MLTGRPGVKFSDFQTEKRRFSGYLQNPPIESNTINTTLRADLERTAVACVLARAMVPWPLLGLKVLVKGSANITPVTRRQQLTAE